MGKDETVKLVCQPHYWPTGRERWRRGGGTEELGLGGGKIEEWSDGGGGGGGGEWEMGQKV